MAHVQIRAAAGAALLDRLFSGNAFDKEDELVVELELEESDELDDIIINLKKQLRAQALP